jgi:hypothetical protein
VANSISPRHTNMTIHVLCVIQTCFKHISY